MSITIGIEIKREFQVAADPDRTFDLLADVPASAAHFPKLHSLTDLGDNAYRWEMDKVGVDRYSIQSIYACQYFPDREAGVIRWEPVPDVGNGRVTGNWTIRPAAGGGSDVVFNTQATLTLNLPSLMKMAISPVVKHEFNSLVDRYVENLKQALST